MRFRLFLASAILAGVLIAASPARAVILYSSGDRNTAAPTGSYANSGWQYEGYLGGWNATVISKKFIITAGHIGAVVGSNFIINGENHRTVAMWQDPKSDLRIFQTVGSYNFAAPLFKDTSESGRSTMIFGRGGARGEEIRVNGELKGWKWEDQDGVLSWGRNAINGVVTGGAKNSQLLKMNFDANGTSYEGMVTGGDSGGGVFVKQGAFWKLAGVNYSVDGPFSLNQDGSDSFSAAVFDRTGLWTSGYGYVADGTPIPGAAYATRISPRVAWIADVLNGRVAPDGKSSRGFGGSPVPEPAGALMMAALAAFGLIRPNRKAQV